MKTLSIILTIFFFIGCGVDTSKLNNTKEDPNTTATTNVPLNAVTDDYFAVEGYVSPINITINGKIYRDSEDFYTQEVERLRVKVNKKYPEYSLYFDADVGLRDFKQGLSVFLVSSSDTGVAGETSVDSHGRFSFSIPSNTDKEQLYTLRASKRIGLRLVKDQDVISWCYNLFAENEVKLEGKPIILRNFETTITSYQCNTEQGGITVPDNPYNYVTEAFENAEEYNGFGPLPKNKEPVVEPQTQVQDTQDTQVQDAQDTQVQDTQEQQNADTESVEINGGN